MKFTDKLGLPIWNEPETDVFNIEHFNKGMKAIDDIVVNISSQLETKVNKSDIETINSQLDTIPNGEFEESTIKKIQDRYIQEYVNVKDFGAMGNGVNDDTNAFIKAITFAIRKNINVLIPSGTFLLTDTINIGGVSTSRVNIIGCGQGRTNLIFNTEEAKNLFYITYNTGYIKLKGFSVTDKNVRVNTFIEFQDDQLSTGSPNWKNSIEDLNINSFNKCIVLNGSKDGNHANDTHLDGMTLSKVSMWNYNVGIEWNNTQAVQIMGYDVDFISTYDSAENSIAILNNCGATWKFEGGSWISKGTFVRFNNGVYNAGNYILNNIRFEFRKNYVNPVISFSDYSEVAERWSKSTFINIDVINCSGAGFGQTITIIKTPVVGNVKFENVSILNAILKADVYRTGETISTSGKLIGSKGKLQFVNCSPIDLNFISDTDKYLTSSNFYPNVTVKNTFHDTASYTQYIDDDGFIVDKEKEMDIQQHYGLKTSFPKLITMKFPHSQRLNPSIRLFMPFNSIPNKILLHLTNVDNTLLGMKVYLVKDKTDWVDGVIDNNALLINTVDFKTDYPNRYGLVEIPFISNTTSYQSFIGEYCLKAGFGSWKEGRIMINFINKSTGDLLTKSATPLEFFGIEYI